MLWSERYRTGAPVPMAILTVETQDTLQSAFPDSTPGATANMHVRKRNGSLEPVDVNKIVRAVVRSADGLSRVDPLKVAVKTIGGLYDGATSRELDLLSIHTAAMHVVEEPQYSRLAARLLATFIAMEVANQDIP